MLGYGQHLNAPEDDDHFLDAARSYGYSSVGMDDTGSIYIDAWTFFDTERDT